jgi:hypothetical protein
VEAGDVGLKSLYGGAVKSSVLERVVERVETFLYIDARRDSPHANAMSVAVLLPCCLRRNLFRVSSSISPAFRTYQLRYSRYCLYPETCTLETGRPKPGD